MRNWTETTVDDLRLGEVINVCGLVDEVVSKHPGSMFGGTATWLGLRNSGPIDLYQDYVVEVFR